MNHLGDLKGQHALGLVDLLAGQRAQAAHLVHGQEGEQPQEALHVLVTHVAPILVELKGRGARGIQPQGALFGLAHLLAVVRHDELAGEGEGVLVLLAADEVRAGEHVAPLVVPAHLQAAAVVFEQLEEVIALHEHVVEFQERQARFHAALVAFGGQHAVDAEQGADLAQKIHIVEVQQPVAVIDHDGLAFAEIQEAGELLLDAADVFADGFAAHHLAHVALAAGIADHGGAAAAQGDRPVPGALQMRHGHDGDVVAHMQAVRRGVKAHVEGHGLALQRLVEVVLKGDLRDETALLEHVQYVHKSSFLSLWGPNGAVSPDGRRRARAACPCPRESAGGWSC